uniref:Putative biorientation of chromosomes in cell division 1 n=1 Tax=Rhodnius prolixus TaxID=13249 RepID=R4FLX9_RHOPR
MDYMYQTVDKDFVETIVGKLKSQGIFDQFRKDCLADVDTKPAYQNLQERVNGTVNTFLEKHKWQENLNKTQLRESLRRHVQQGFLETGVDRIVDQVVNPKIYTVFKPKVEDVVYASLGIPKPIRPPPHPPPPRPPPPPVKEIM